MSHKKKLIKMQRFVIIKCSIVLYERHINKPQMSFIHGSTKLLLISEHISSPLPFCCQQRVSLMVRKTFLLKAIHFGQRSNLLIKRVPSLAPRNLNLSSLPVIQTIIRGLMFLSNSFKTNYLEDIEMSLLVIRHCLAN